MYDTPQIPATYPVYVTFVTLTSTVSTMPETNGVAANVRAQLARHLVSQRTVATVLGLTKTAVSRRLRGITEFRADELQAIATHLGVDVASFYNSEVA